MGNVPCIQESIHVAIRERPAALKWEFVPLVGAHDPTSSANIAVALNESSEIP